MNLIGFMIAAFIIVLIAYVMLAETIQRQEKRPTTNAISDKAGNKIKIHINNNTKRRER